MYFIFCIFFFFLFFFFFQAEDGIRDTSVTGVQTCALPIYVPDASAHRTALERARRLPRGGAGPQTNRVFGDAGPGRRCFRGGDRLRRSARDRKSTRLNSSHRCISYAVFCLKKKKKNDTKNT